MAKHGITEGQGASVPGAEDKYGSQIPESAVKKDSPTLGNRITEVGSQWGNSASPLSPQVKITLDGVAERIAKSFIGQEISDTSPGTEIAILPKEVYEGEVLGPEIVDKTPKVILTAHGISGVVLVGGDFARIIHEHLASRNGEVIDGVVIFEE